MEIVTRGSSREIRRGAANVVAERRGGGRGGALGPVAVAGARTYGGFHPSGCRRGYSQAAGDWHRWAAPDWDVGVRLWAAWSVTTTNR